MKDYKFIFLDFDGCANNYKETPGSYVTHNPEEYGPSVSNIQNLRNLCEDSGARIVLTTNWRKFDLDGPRSYWQHPNGNKLQNPLRKLYQEIGDLIYCQMPPYRHMVKAEALILWFEENDFSGKFVIFDDDLREKYSTTHDYQINQHYVHINPEYGITEADCLKAKEILEKL